MVDAWQGQENHIDPSRQFGQAPTTMSTLCLQTIDRLCIQIKDMHWHVTFACQVDAHRLAHDTQADKPHHIDWFLHGINLIFIVQIVAPSTAMTCSTLATGMP
ncbi:hypothetical protein D3C84_885240 [compost metagenome]